MEPYEDDEDTHFCIKCHATINGLDNYVRHRQSGCCRSSDKGEVGHDPPITSTTVTYPEILNADAFFSSLELQSSSKKNSRGRSTTLLDRARKSERLEVRRKNRKSQVDPEDGCTKVLSQEKLHNMLPVVTDLDDPTDHLGIPSLVGFPDIVSSTGKPATVTSSKTCSQKIESSSYHGKADALPEASLESLMVEGAESKQQQQQQQQQQDRKRHEDSQRMDQEWLEDTILVDLVGNAENKEIIHAGLPRYSEYDYHQEDDSEDESLEEEDSYSETDDGEDREYPPQSHTGGKWRPGLDTTQIVEDDGEPEEDQSEHPPPSYTGGKWKPTEQTQKVEEYESKEAVGQPPPGHTRGKWIPGARTDVGATGYWCSPCGRKLASRLVYNRHLLSDLHARRSMQEIDGVIRLPREAGPISQRRSGSRRQRTMSLKCRYAEEDLEEIERNKRQRKREKEVLPCEMCHARVRRFQMGKHLLSHYHCRVAGATSGSLKARRFLLENMANVVRQCPFQCAACRFYCNTEETFLFHWRSSFHSEINCQIKGSYLCVPCDFWCNDSERIEAHITSSSHQDVVSMMNGSVPVVIRRQRPLPCDSCNRRFRYNLQLILHARKTGHETFTASDEYQRRIACSLCSHIFHSLVSLQRHQLACHPTDNREIITEGSAAHPTPYFCSFCSLNFATAQEAVLHRRTSRHKETVRAHKCEKGLSSSTVRECPHCGERQPDLVQHKEHLLQNHPELCHRCPQCGALFALPQDVTRHTKGHDCSIERGRSTMIDGSEYWRCGSCAFGTNSQAEFMFHEALHAGSVETVQRESGNGNEDDDNDDDDDDDDDDNETGNSKVFRKYRCPVCQKPFAKVSLRNHIRGHTGERPFPCAKCFASFPRRSALNAHQKECSTSGWPDGETARRRSYVCSECNNAFYTKHALRQHMLRHAGKKYKCGLPGCPTVLRTASELKTHRILVHDSTSADRTHKCTQCAYSAKTATQLRRHSRRHEKSADGENSGRLCCCPHPGCRFRTKLSSHLRRHVRCHTGTKPYKCRHCTYASNNLENLRKHVLSTNLHPGKTIYQCDYCTEETFCTNFAKELRAHLLHAHGDKFPTPTHTSTYVASIFESNRDSPVTI